MKKLESKDLDDIVHSLNKILKVLTEQHVAAFTSKAQGLVVEGSNWSAKVVANIRDLSR